MSSTRDALINMRNDEREDKKRAAAQDLPSGTISTSTAPGETTLDIIGIDTNNTSQHHNICRPRVARTVQPNRKSIAIQVDIDDDCPEINRS